MKAIVLGSATAAGLPAWNDGSPLALRARAGDPAVPRRRAAALAVSADGRRYSVLEAPLPLAGLLADDSRFAPVAGSRSVPLDSLVLTCGELDACAGALAFARGLSLRIASTHALRDSLTADVAGFRGLAACWTGHALDRPFPLDREGRLEARFFPLAGAPSGPRAGVRVTDVDTGARLVWAPRIARFDSATLAELRAAELRFVDGTCHADEEGRLIHPAARSARELGHVPIDGRDGSLVWLSGMAGRSVYVHLAASNPACEEGGKAWSRIHETGAIVARDGLELDT